MTSIISSFAILRFVGEIDFKDPKGKTKVSVTFFDFLSFLLFKTDVQ